MTHAGSLATVSLVALAAAFSANAPAYADALLTGLITSATGEKIGGVTISAKAEGSTITTSVYTDETGRYYFPPLPEGKYRVWAQAIKYQTANGNVELNKTSRQDFMLRPMSNQEDWIRQLPGDEFLAALPGDTPEDARMKVQVRKNCTGCHSASYPLQHRFDEDGWNKVLDLMKQVNVYGSYPRPDKLATPNIDFHQKQLAAYLSRARGPGETSMKSNLRPRPSGEAARAVFREYDFPIEGGRTLSNDGSDWSFGTPSRLNHVPSLHDAQMDFDGNVWITFDQPNLEATVARLDTRTGAGRRRQPPQRVDPSLEHGPHREIRSDRRQMDAVRSPDQGIGVALHLAP